MTFKRKEIPGLHILKAICAIMVVEIHIHSLLHEYVLPLIHTAVPIFLIITGYFLPNDAGELSEQKLKSNLKKYLHLIIFGNLIYLGYEIYNADFDPNFIREYLAFKHIRDAVLFGDYFMIHLWYLTAVFWALIFILITVKLRCLNLIPIMAIIGMLWSSFVLFPLAPQYAKLGNGFYCIAYILVGIILRKYHSYLIDQLYAVCYFLIAALVIQLSAALLFPAFTSGEAYLTNRPPLAISIFILFCHVKNNGKFSNCLYNIGRNYSLDIYLWHFLFFFILLKVLRIVNTIYGVNIIYGRHITFVVTFGLIITIHGYKTYIKPHITVVQRPLAKVLPILSGQKRSNL